MKRLQLTSIKRILNEAAQKRLEEFEDSDEYDEPTDENGRTAEWYNDLNIPLPEELKKSPQDYIQFDLEKDYDAYDIDVVVNMNEFVMAVDEIEFGSVIYLKNGNSIEIIEDCADINAQIWWNTRSKWQIFKEYIKNKYKKVINKFNNKQK